MPASFEIEIYATSLSSIYRMQKFYNSFTVTVDSAEDDDAKEENYGEDNEEFSVDNGKDKEDGGDYQEVDDDEIKEEV